MVRRQGKGPLRLVVSVEAWFRDEPQDEALVDFSWPQIFNADQRCFTGLHGSLTSADIPLGGTGSAAQASGTISKKHGPKRNCSSVRLT